MVIIANLLLKRAKAKEPPEEPKQEPVLQTQRPLRPTPSPPPIRIHTPSPRVDPRDTVHSADDPPPRYEDVKNDVVRPAPNFFNFGN